MRVKMNAGRRIRYQKSQEEHKEPSLLSDEIRMNILSGAGLLDSMNCALSEQRTFRSHTEGTSCVAIG